MTLVLYFYKVFVLLCNSFVFLLLAVVNVIFGHTCSAEWGTSQLTETQGVSLGASKHLRVLSQTYLPLFKDIFISKKVKKSHMETQCEIALN